MSDPPTSIAVMNPLCRLLLALALITFGCLALVQPGSAAPAPPVGTARHVLGPGRTTEPGFVGFVTAGGAALGVARLPDGRYGVCLDTGSRGWPQHAGHDVSRTDPRTGYLISRYLPAARRHPVTAAALWWAVGLDLGLNSGPARMRSHLRVVRAEAPHLFGRIRHRHRMLLDDLRAHVSPTGRYVVGRPVLRATWVTGLGVSSDSGVAVPGVAATLHLRGGTFGAGEHTWRGTVPVVGARGPVWHRHGSERVGLTVRYAGIPAAAFHVVRSGPRYQRVAVSTGTIGRVRTASLPALSLPAVQTTISSTRTTVGNALSDAVTVTGAGRAALTGRWRLLGPALPGSSGCRDADWTSAPTAGSGSFAVTGGSTVRVGVATITVAGCFTYIERLDGSASTRATDWTAPGEPSETTLTLARPTVRTQVSRRVATVGALVRDVVTIGGVPTSESVRLHWRLLGPVAPRGSTCRGAEWTGAPVRAAGMRAVDHDGRVSVGRRRIGHGGCYTYQERLGSTPLSVATAWTMPGVVPESTTVGPRAPRLPSHPRVDTGGSRSAVRALRTIGDAGTVHIPGSGQATPLAPMVFRGSTLTPPSTAVGGWWAGGARLGALVGTTIVAGHVSDDHGRLGPFARLRRTRVGSLVTTSSAGVSTRWRVTEIRSFDRRRLPRALFGQHLVRRLVLITCTDKVTRPGGAFHYRRNLVVTAVPVLRR